MKETQGNLNQTGMPKLLDLIYREGDAAGVLEISREKVKRRFFFSSGAPVSSSSNVLGDVLGRLLMQEGVITEKDYESSLETVLAQKKKHGEVLISMGLITEAELENFLVLQLKRRIWKAFGWNDGQWHYSKADTLPYGITHFPMHPAQLILDGVDHGFYPAARLQKDLKDFLDKPLKVSKDVKPYRLEDFGLTIQVKRFLESFDGKKPLAAVLKATDLLSHRASALALTFIITGLVKRADVKDEIETAFDNAVSDRKAYGQPAAAPEVAAQVKINAEILFMKARRAMDEGNFETAENILSEITELNPFEGEYWACLGWTVFKRSGGSEKEVKRAERLVKDAIDLNNELEDAWYFLGMLSLDSGNLEEAEKAFYFALAKNPWMLKALAELKRIEIEKTGKSSKYPAMNKKQKEAVTFLARCVVEKKPGALLEGEKGPGRTAVMLELLKALTDKRILAAAVLGPAQKELNFIKAINAELGTPRRFSTVKEELLSLELKASQNHIHGGQTLLIIDNAEQLTDACLKLLAAATRIKHLQTILIADTAFKQRLADPALIELGQRLVDRYTL
ncbi:MAG: tetratricopeptide repeat protein [Deltaproteobacteria bacterium]|nr:tetratricopeptide repeat protein [Deltaproteobacteria bacterium]